MADFKKSNRFGGGGGNRFGKKSFGGKPNFERRGGGRDGGNREMFDAVCSKCGKDCQLPFRPDGRKPVFCRDCFGNQTSDSMTFPTHNNFEKRDFAPAPSFNKAPVQDNRGIEEVKRTLDIVTSKLDLIIKVMESMTARPAAAPAAAPSPTKETPKAMIASGKTKEVAKKSAPKKKIAAKKKK